MWLYVRNFLVVVIAFGFGTMPSKAQNLSAWSFHFPLPELTAWMDYPIPVEKMEQLLEEERDSQSQLKTWIYAVGIDVEIEPQTSGQWDIVPGRGYVWRTGIHVEKALSLNLFLENYKMEPGMTLYVYSETKDNIAGPFDSSNNVNGGVLPVQSLPCNRIIVELNIPETSNFKLHTTNMKPFSIVSIGYGFRDMRNAGKIIYAALGEADICNIDINCKTGNHWHREKKSVVLMETILPDRRSQYCTGTLINQAVETERKKPYIITANHCVSTQELAKNTTFIFGYENELCDGPPPVKLPGITGSTLIVTKRNLDFSLLELSDNVLTAEHRPFYAGWNASTTVPQGAIGIHHPQGDVKKISLSLEPLSSSTFIDKVADLECDKNAHWVVENWHEGVTENGSSGSPIFDAEHRIVGLLSGGVATCANPKKDYYSKFSEQWNKYANECLKPYLDPDNKGVTSLFGYDPVAPFEGKCDTLGHIGRNETKTLIESGTKGYLTSRNDRNWISFAEKIENDTVAKIIGMEIHVANVFKSGSKVKFTIWRGDDFPVATMYEKEITVTEDYSMYPLHIYLEKTLEITGNFFIGYSLEYSNPLDNFAVFQSAIRPYSGLAGMYIEESDGTWKPLNDFVPPVYSSLGVSVFGKFDQKTKTMYLSSDRMLKVLSQPGSDVAFLLFDIEESSDFLQAVKIECYDTSGKLMLLFNDVKGRMNVYSGKTYLQVEMNIANLIPGVYLIRAMDTNKKWSGKFVRNL